MDIQEFLDSIESVKAKYKEVGANALADAEEETRQFVCEKNTVVSDIQKEITALKEEIKADASVCQKLNGHMMMFNSELKRVASQLSDAIKSKSELLVKYEEWLKKEGK